MVVEVQREAGLDRTRLPAHNIQRSQIFPRRMGSATGRSRSPSALAELYLQEEHKVGPNNAQEVF